MNYDPQQLRLDGRVFLFELIPVITEHGNLNLFSFLFTDVNENAG